MYQNPYYVHRGIRKLSFTHWRMKHFPKFVFFLVVSIILSEVCIRDSVLTFYLKKIEKCKGFHRKKNLIFQINRCRPYNYLELFLRFKVFEIENIWMILVEKYTYFHPLIAS